MHLISWHSPKIRSLRIWSSETKTQLCCKSVKSLNLFTFYFCSCKDKMAKLRVALHGSIETDGKGMLQVKTDARRQRSTAVSVQNPFSDHFCVCACAGGLCFQLDRRRCAGLRPGAGRDPVPYKSRADCLPPLHRETGGQRVSDHYR